jgi:multiple sugar transport system substrate-binding protein
MSTKKISPFTLFLYLLFCVFIILAPFYFVKNKPAEDIGDTKKTEDHWKGVISLWDYPWLDITNGTRYEWITSKIKAFEKDNPGVYIELKSMDPKFGMIELSTAIRTKTYPDIAPVAADPAIISKNVLEPLDQYLSKKELKDYKPQALKAVRYKEKMWGIPWMMTSYTMLLNTELFHEKDVALPRDGKWTYEEFVKKLKLLTYDKDGDGKNDIYGFNACIQSNDDSLWGILLSDGAEIFDEKNKTYCFNDKRAVSGLKKLTDLKLLYKVTPDHFGRSTEKEAWESFYKEKKVAVYPARSDQINILNDLQKRGQGFEFAVANYPVGKKGMSVNVSQNISAYGIFKQEDPQKLEMCVKFLKFITQDKYQKELNRLGVFPVKRNINDLYKKDRCMRQIEKNLEDIVSVPAHSNWSDIEEIIQSQIRQVLLKKKSVTEALKHAEQKISVYNKMM